MCKLWGFFLGQAMVFTAASEDYNLYSFDMRKLDRPLNVHMDHVAAVIDVDYSPTGKSTGTESSVSDPYSSNRDLAKISIRIQKNLESGSGF